MRPFSEIFAMAVGHRGSAGAVEALLPVAKSRDELAAIPDHRWLAALTRAVFQAGFNWKVIEAKWPGFEQAFDGFDPNRWAMMSDEDLDRLTADTRVVRNAAKLKSVGDNAAMLVALAREHGSAAAVFADWPADDYAGLLQLLKDRGNRLGGAAAQYALRSLGRDGYVLGGDVVVALIREGVIDKPPTSRSAMAGVQAAFNRWMAESGRGLGAISRTLALSVGPRSPV